jgi:hypothetical protein
MSRLSQLVERRRKLMHKDLTSFVIKESQPPVESTAGFFLRKMCH